MSGRDWWDIGARVRERVRGDTKSAPAIKQAFVDRHGSGETDSEWSIRCFDGGLDDTGGWSRQMFGEKTVYVNATQIKQRSTAENDATIAHERGHQENEYWLARGFWIGSIAVPALLTIDSFFFADAIVFGFDLQRFVFLLGSAVGMALIALWWSRYAEYRADRFAVERLGSSEPVIAMLRGMQNGDDRADKFGYTVRRLFETHPLPSERIEKIKEREKDEQDEWNGGSEDSGSVGCGEGDESDG